MRHLERLRHLLRTLFRGRRVERELGEEADDFVERLTARHRAGGLNPAAARRAALVELGGVERMKEEARAVRQGQAVDSTMQDVRYAWRALIHAPGFTLAALLTIGLGVGAMTAIFTVVKATLIEPLPYRDAGRLMLVWADLTDLGYPHAPLAGPELVEFQRAATRFEAFGGIWATTSSIAGEGDPDQLRIATVTADFFKILGVPSALGTVIGPEHFGQSVRPVLLSDALWRSRFGADRSIVGRKIVMNDRPAIVIGVMPSTFHLVFPSDGAVPDDLQAWVPGGPRPASEPRGQQYLRVVGRLKPGATIAEGRDEVAAVGAAMMRQFPGQYTPGEHFFGVSMQQDAVAPVKPALLAVFGGAALLLVIACVNVAGLLLVRAAGRGKETAVRLALGASRGRLVRQDPIEGLLLSGLGSAIGIALAYGGLKIFISLAPASVPLVGRASIDLVVLAVALLIAVVWALVFSIAPMAEAGRVTARSLQQDSRGSAGSISQRGRSVLVGVQIALGVVLLVGAGLMARAFDRLMHVDPGFDGSHAMTFRVSVPFSRYSTQAAQTDFHRRLSAALRAMPSVTGVGAVSHLPYDNLPNWAFPYTREGEIDPTRQGLADARTVSPGFFEAVKARLIDGRFFSEDDVAARGELPVIIDDRMAALLWPGQSPIGRAFPIDPGGSGTFSTSGRVVGLVQHLRHRTLTEPGREQVFVPARLVPRSSLAYVVKTSGDPLTLARPIRDAVKSLDPLLPIFDLRSLDDYFVAARSASRFTLMLSATFAGVALVLACVGLYGVVAYAASRRRREFGIRLALGARRSALLAMVLREGGRVAVVGLAAGVVGALVVAGLLKSQLYATTPYDPGVYAMAVCALAVAAMGACLPPAWRAGSAGVARVLNEEE